MAAGLFAPGCQNDGDNGCPNRDAEGCAARNAIREQMANRRGGMLPQGREYAREEKIESHLSKFHHVLWPMKTQAL